MRYAIYYAPQPDTALWRLGSALLGYDAVSGQRVSQPSLAGLSAEQIDQATQTPQRYGLHATLKPPFYLSNGASEQDLIAAFSAFKASAAATWDAGDGDAAVMPALRLSCLHGFMALTPKTADDKLAHWAGRCLAAFESFRAPPSPAELERRRQAAPLSPRQERMLAIWGYPYVFDEFRFHITLTGRLPQADRPAWERALATYLAPALEAPPGPPRLCLYRQASPKQRFVQLSLP